MRIAFIVSRFPVLSETFIVSQITGLLDRGHQVDIFAKQRADSSKLNEAIERYRLLDRAYFRGVGRAAPPRSLRGVVDRAGFVLRSAWKKPLACLKALNIFEFGLDAAAMRVLYKLTPFLDKDPYDIVHCHFGPNGILGVFLRDMGAIEGKIITTFHGHDISAYVRSYGGHVYDDLFSKGDLFMYTNGHVKERLIAIGCDERKTALHRVDVDTSRFVFAPRERVANQPVRLLTVARLVEKKGVEYSIRAVAQVLARHPDLTYDIVGAGPLREQLQGLIDELGVGAAIRLLGPKSPAEVRKMIADAHLFVLASVTAADGDKEGLPVALLEAQAAGLPVVCTRHSGSPEAIVEGQSGYLVPERDVGALAERITCLVERPETWPALGRVGRRHIEAHFDTNMLNDRLVQQYQRVLDGASYEG